jgi:sugar transferase (PEP-CTERM/EpsH1 system associated)
VVGVIDARIQINEEGMRILFLTGRLPYPPNRGDRLRAYHFLRVLSREHSITLLSFVADDRETGNVGPLRQFCQDIQLIHRSPWQSKVSTSLNIWRPLPLQLLYYHSPVMQGAVNRLLARREFDAVYVHLFRMAQYVAQVKQPLRILDLTDAISGEIRRSLPYRTPLWRIIYRMELPRIVRYERAIVRRFDETWVISEAERRLLADESTANVHIVPNGVDAQRYRPAGVVVHSPTLLFVGHMGVFHNVDAAEYLVKDVLPLVRQSIPAAELNLVGAEPAAHVRRLAKVSGVRVPGHVSDLNAELNRAAVFVAPLRFSAGIQNKVLEAMAAGLPVVTTSDVNSGLQAEDGRHLIVADEPAQMAAAIVSLLGDPDARRRIGREGRAFVLRRFRWEDVLDRMNTIERQSRAH